MKHAYRLILITQRGDQPLSSYLNFIKDCAVSGISAVQLREKNYSSTALLEFAQQLKETLAPYHIPLLINDQVELAQHVSTEGVHLGQTDFSSKEAKKFLGLNKIVGLSIESEQELISANDQTELDYVAASAVFVSKNKTNLKTLWGLEGLKNVIKISRHPVVAIGGINLDNARKVMQCGAAGIAVIGAIHDAKKPALACEHLRKIIDEYT